FWRFACTLLTAADPRSRPSFPPRRSSDLCHEGSAVRDASGEPSEGRIPARNRAVSLAVILSAARTVAERITANDTARFLAGMRRSEEHTSELQSRRDIVCRLLLEKKKHMN